MKIVLLLLVCLAASTQASQAGPLHQIVDQIEQHIETALQTFKAQILALIQAHQPQINDLLATVQSLVSALPGIKEQLIQKVKDTLVQLVQNFFQKNNSRQVAEAKIFGQLQDLAAQLQHLAGSILNHFVNAATDAANKPKSLAPAIQSIIDQLKDKLTQTIAQLTNFLLSHLQSQKRDLSDFILNSLGLGAVWDEIKELGNGLIGQLMTIGTQLLFQGQQVWNNAKPILAQLVSDLTAHTGNAATIVAQAISNLQGVISKPSSNKRDLWDSLGLTAVWDQIKELGMGVVGQFVQIGTELLFAGKQKWEEVKVVLNQLVADLTSHTGSASQIVAQAIASVQQLLNGNNKRDWLSDLGLTAVWDQIKELGLGAVAQIVQIGSEMLFAGQQKWTEVQAIFNQLVADLTSHTGSASQIFQQAINAVQQVLGGSSVQKRDLISDTLNNLGLTAVWDQIKELGLGVVAQFVQIGTELLFAGQQKWEEVKVVFNQLIADLTSHTGSASQIVAQAISAVQQLLKPQNNKRSISDFVINTLGLGQVWDTISQLGGNAASQLMAIGTQLLFAGQQLFKEKILPILSQLVSDLTNHVGDASTIVSQAISQLNNVLSNNTGKRDLLDQLGLTAVWDQIKELGMGVIAQFAQIGAELLFAGQQKWTEVQAIFNQLVADLTSHTGSASQIVAQAIASVQQLLQGNNKRGITDFIIESFGLSGVWNQITSVGSSLFQSFINTSMRILFAGRDLFNKAKPIFIQLVKDLASHTGDAITIVGQSVSQLNALLSGN
jgi:hypothetical protein